MTDTGQIPGEGLPENAGMVEQPGIPAPGAYTYLESSESPENAVHSENGPEEDDLLLMPGSQGAWSDSPVPAPAPGAHQQAAPAADQYAAAPVSVQATANQEAGPQHRSGEYQMDHGAAGYAPHDYQAAPVVHGAEQPAAQPVPPVTENAAPGPEFVEVTPDAGASGHAQQQFHGGQAQAAAAHEPLAQVQGTMSVVPGVAPAAEAAPAVADAAPQQAAQAAHPQAEAQAAVHEAGAHEAGGRDSGAVDLGAVRTPAAATSAMPTPAPARRPLHMGPPVPDTSSGVVRSLADRGPASGTPPHPMAVRTTQAQAQAVATTGVEYLDVPREDPGAELPGPQLGEIPPQAGAPWDPQPPQEQTAAPAETVVPTDPANAEATVPAPRAGGSDQQPPVAPEGAVPDTAAEPEVSGHAASPAPAPTEAAAPAAADAPSPATAEPETTVAEGTAQDAAPAEAQPAPVETEPASVAPEATDSAVAAAQAAAPETEEGADVDAPADAAEAAAAQSIPEAAAEGWAAPQDGTVPQNPEPAPASPETPDAAGPVAVAADTDPSAASAAETPAAETPAPGTAPAAEAATPGPAPAGAESPEGQPVVAAEPAEPGAVGPAGEHVPGPQPTAADAVEPGAEAPADGPAPTAGPVAGQSPDAAQPATAPGAETAQAAAEPAGPDPEAAPDAPPADAATAAAPEAGPDAAQPDPVPVSGDPAGAESPEAHPTAPAPGYGDAEREAVLRVMRERRDIRNGFRSDPIPHEVLLRVLEAAHTAPSVGHSQPWDFVVIRSAETRRTMHELAQRQREAYAKSLPKGRAKQFKELKIEAILDTPVNIVVTADPTRGGRHTLGRHTQPQMAPYSSALAVENLWLAARAEGLGVGWVSFFDEREMVRTLGLPDHLEVVAYLCVGYVDEFPEEPELMQAGWSKRRPLSWVVHEETYGRRALPGEQPHDLLQETVTNIRPLDAKALGEAWERQKRMTKPSGALGMLEIISAQLSGLSRMCPPPIPEPAAVAIFAGDHGVHAQGVTAWPQEVTSQMVANFLGGGAVCNAFANQVGAEVCVIDVGVASDLPATPGLLPRKVRPGTADFTTGQALSREEVLSAIEVGIETARDLVAAGNKALLAGEMGIANTTASAALIAVYTGADPSEITGRGTGINDEMHARKVDVVRRALELHRPDPADPIGVLAAVGGLEHCALVGLILGGASLRTPVILDGVSTGAAALVARAVAPEALAACIAGHRSAEPGHVAALNKLGLRPLVDLDLRLGEGTGALLALPLVQSAARAMHEVATFDSAGVTEK
ncbi:nicotinate-nucleotide--dimethylbenzimidazole phosphoribosyltransferase [Streptomyces peucetius]|uniref:Nicotinate-nucleotide--dimethylbenzimidazole phosphoribosyltransferase n=1 Tax=Streptomyces peucetius TaxID=1950 RepID=A0ABY6I4E2_STRPE|nr:nicotinate-nucleotide--dimethylbenzimidazole phosphoribosyltransferase [Streptomyces peucetius]UYQ61140.1 nicotinate-nucleotide--dimethylbenzimidazole phosphoribosyltransferase [Streptomyces peucetius]